MKKLGYVIIAFTVIFAGLTGCGQKTAITPPGNTDVPEINAPSDPDKEKPAEEEPAAGVKTNSGVYVGQLDSNSIEIEVNGQSQVFRLNSELKENFEQLAIEEGETVKFRYEINQNGQSVIREIEKS
ncbi:MAG: hypothetical protein LBT22_06530 [Peptococcaceae bacterium]|nr:hypothetical protein [Peptococcaceae bacterium]